MRADIESKLIAKNDARIPLHFDDVKWKWEFWDGERWVEFGGGESVRQYRAAQADAKGETMNDKDDASVEFMGINA